MDAQEQTFDQQVSELIEDIRPRMQADPTFILEVLQIIKNVRIQALEHEAAKRRAVVEARLLCQGEVKP